MSGTWVVFVGGNSWLGRGATFRTPKLVAWMRRRVCAGQEAGEPPILWSTERGCMAQGCFAMRAECPRRCPDATARLAHGSSPMLDGSALRREHDERHAQDRSGSREPPTESAEPHVGSARPPTGLSERPMGSAAPLWAKWLIGSAAPPLGSAEPPAGPRPCAIRLCHALAGDMPGVLRGGRRVPRPPRPRTGLRRQPIRPSAPTECKGSSRPGGHQIRCAGPLGLMGFRVCVCSS